MVEFSLITNGQEHRRNTAVGCKADYYRNLNRHGFFSCRSREGIHKGKVTCYANMFVVLNPTFVVSSASRNRVIANNKRNVHAFVRSSSLIDGKRHLTSRLKGRRELTDFLKSDADAKHIYTSHLQQSHLTLLLADFSVKFSTDDG